MNMMQRPGALSQTQMYDPTGGFGAGQGLMGAFSLPGSMPPSGGSAPPPGGLQQSAPPQIGALQQVPPLQTGALQQVPPLQTGALQQVSGGPGGGAALGGAAPGANAQQNLVRTDASNSWMPPPMPLHRPSDAEIAAYYRANVGGGGVADNGAENMHGWLAHNRLNLADLQRAMGPGVQLPAMLRQQEEKAPLIRGNPTLEQLYASGEWRNNPEMMREMHRIRDAMGMRELQKYNDEGDARQAVVTRENQNAQGMLQSELDRITNEMSSRGANQAQIDNLLQMVRQQYQQNVFDYVPSGTLNPNTPAKQFQFQAPEWYDLMLSRLPGRSG